MGRLVEHGFSPADLAELSSALRRLTNRIMHGETALWRRDRAKIDVLAKRFPIICDAKIDKISRIYWLLEDCKRHGGRCHSPAPRGRGFTAVQMCSSPSSRRAFLNAGEWREAFMASVDTVGSAKSGEISRNFQRQTSRRAAATSVRGPLRYPVAAIRRGPRSSISTWPECPAGRARAAAAFAPRSAQLRRIEHPLKEQELDIYRPWSLTEFIKAGIEGREYAKFVFTQSLSLALLLIRQLSQDSAVSPGGGLCISNHDVVRTLYSESGPVREAFAAKCRAGQERSRAHAQSRIRPIIASPDEVLRIFTSPEPTGITRRQVHRASRLLSANRRRASLDGFFSCPARTPASTGSSLATSADSSPSSAALIRTWRFAPANWAFPL